jgi:stage IV sporulation protein B
MLLQTYLVFPSRLLIFKGEEYTYDIATPFSLDAKVDKSGILSINGNVVEDNYKLDSNNPLVIKSDEQGIYNIDFKIFGIVPFRTVEVNVLPKINVVPCGNTIGVKLKTNGVLVVGKSYIENDDGERLEPWKEAGIREGDILLKVNNKKINDTGHLIEILQEISEQAIFIDVKRKDDIYTVKINTVKEKNTDTYKLGLWVRDSTAGIGTLTFYEPFTNYFGALGHGITDVDTGSLLSVGEGNILKSNIISIKKGKRGDPGELKGVFLHGDDMIGDILSNSDYGIFGEIKSEVADVGNESIPVAFRTEVEEGSAYILSNIEGNKIEKFDIEIQKIMRQNERSTKGMIIEITDKDLLEKTGGIVQGMSGSPIIQNDKIVGAITHVFINDPKRGYGIFIDWMVETILEISAKNIK